MSEKPFENIGKDFPALNSLCGNGLSNKGANDFAKVASGIHSVLSSWQEYLEESASQDKAASSHKNYNNAKLKCKEDEYTKDFEILERDRIDALDILKQKDNAYLLTSLVLAGSLAPHAMKSIDRDAYESLKDYVRMTLEGGNPSAILNDPRKSSMALLVWNSIANMHLEGIEVEILKSQLARLEAGFKANAALTKELQSKLIEVKAGGGMVGGAISLQLGGDRRKRRSSPKRPKRSKSRRRKSRSKRRRSRKRAAKK